MFVFPIKTSSLFVLRKSAFDQTFRTFKKQPKLKATSRNTKKSKNTTIDVPKRQNTNYEELFSSPLKVTLKYGLYSCTLTAVVFGTGAVCQYINHSDKSLDHSKYWEQFDSKFENKKEIELRQTLNEIWNHLPRASKFTLGIIGCNLAVFIGWKLLPIATMTRWFTLSAIKGHNAYVTMITSNFSHKHLLHFGINMYVFLSFSKAWNSRNMHTNPECMSGERLLSFFTIAGVFGCYLSLIVKTLSRNLVPSLGASAAIMGLIGYVCEKRPDNKLSIVFIPGWHFSAGTTRDFIIAFDVGGLLLGALTKWRYYVLDHAGHLGGMMFGLWYAKTGELKLNKFCKKVMIAYHKRDD